MITWEDGTPKSTDNFFNVAPPSLPPIKKKRVYVKRIRKYKSKKEQPILVAEAP